MGALGLFVGEASRALESETLPPHCRCGAVVTIDGGDHSRGGAVEKGACSWGKRGRAGGVASV